MVSLILLNHKFKNMSVSCSSVPKINFPVQNRVRD
nr:MAG TPA: hypothetical protein [Caudoviricetes sp.]